MAAISTVPYQGATIITGPLDVVSTWADGARDAGGDVALVELRGDDRSLEEFTRRARLGDAELAARKARRKAQRAARRRNR